MVSVSAAHERRQNFEGWRDKPNQAGAGDGVEREACDPRQRFAHDIVKAKALEREDKMTKVEQLREYNPLRLLVFGPAGTGKSLFCGVIRDAGGRWQWNVAGKRRRRRAIALCRQLRRVARLST